MPFAKFRIGLAATGGSAVSSLARYIKRCRVLGAGDDSMFCSPCQCSISNPSLSGCLQVLRERLAFDEVALLQENSGFITRCTAVPSSRQCALHTHVVTLPARLTPTL